MKIEDIPENNYAANAYANSLWKMHVCSSACAKHTCSLCGKKFSLADIRNDKDIKDKFLEQTMAGHYSPYFSKVFDIYRAPFCSFTCSNQKKANEEKESKKTNIITLMEDAGFPKRFSSASFESLKYSCESEKKIIEEIKNINLSWFKNNNNPFVLLYGPTGTGKTHLAACIFRELIIDYHKNSFKFVSVPQLMLSIRKTFSDDSSELSIINKYTASVFLTLDDMGAQKQSEFSAECLYALIDKRYGEMRPTIFTTNLNPTSLGDMLGSRLSSRILSGKIINISGLDKRLKK